MRVAYVSATDPTSSKSGSALAVAGWLGALTARAVDVEVVTRGPTAGRETAGDVAVHRLDEPWPDATLPGLLDRLDPAVVLAQGGWATLALDAADDLGIPSVLSVTAVRPLDDALDGRSPTRFVANSRYTQQWITTTCGRDSTLVYPHVDFEFYDAGRDPDGAVSMVNPVRAKGAGLFERLAAGCPDREFLAKRGWYGIRNADDSWDRETMAVVARTFSAEPEPSPGDVDVPDETTFDDAGNVEYEAARDILGFYARTRVLVVPSLWREAFGRVVVEAMWNRIPVVASHRGGLPEAGGGAALLVDDYEDPRAWLDRLRRLDDPGRYDVLAERGRRRAERYRAAQPDRMDRLVETLRDAAEG